MSTARSRLVLLLFLGASSTALAQRSPGLTPSPLGQPPFGQQQKVPPDSSTAPLKVTTQLTLEDVTVTDAAGKPVLGLKQSDFSIKEDGKPQKIRNFEEYSAAIPSRQSAPPALPPGTYTNRQSAASGAVNILLLDDVTHGTDLHLSSEDPAFTRLQAIKYLKTMPEGTQVAILKMANELSVVQGFTSDRNVLLAAIDSVKPDPAPGTYLPPRTQRGTPAPPDEECDVMNRQSDLTTAALTGIARFVSGIKGRKNLIWFTPGIPWLTNYGGVALLLALPCLRDYSPQLHNAYGLLTAARVAVYPIDPKGLTENSRIQDQLSVQDIANNTGGKAYYNRNDIDGAIGEAIATGADYYSLSYVPPPSKYDDKYHMIEVKIDRPGLHLQYREGYTDTDPAKPLGEKKDTKNVPAPDSDFHAAVDQSVVPSTGLLFYLRVTPSTAQAKPGDPPAAGMLNSKLKGKPLVRYALTYEVPPGEVTLVDGKGSLEFDVVAYGEDGEKLNVVRETVNFTLKPSEVEHFVKSPTVMPVQIDLPPGKLFLRAGVLDVSSQKMGTLEIPETVTSKQ